ncbi:hypothetical protein Q5P01_007524 [Channa striata]|uniref:Synaptonemal complex protein 2 n=1 Tax=Channa striata TaxID=64152 RepID=A0AA88T1S2_CHASR|nr:hypothetical protein Q5P01_007524 [Channa striata]
MAPNRDRQLEKVIGDVLKSGNVQALDAFLQKDISEGTTIKCSQQFLDKLDKFVIRSLEQKDSKSASLGFAIISKCGKNLKLPGDDQGLSGIIAQGLIGKIINVFSQLLIEHGIMHMEQWFEKCRQLWIQCGTQWDETLFNLSEDFFEALLVVHEACKEGTESFLYHLGHLGVDPRIYILIQKEAIRKFNLILDKIPVELKKERNILTSKEASDIMIKLAGQVMKGGDYDFQTALIEALCRMATRDQRKELAHQWFSMEHVATAFSRVHDSEFETDCRKFLNLVNGMQGDRRRVYSYPCLEVYLDKYELLMPADEKLETFWIDFNLGSQSISFYFSSADEEAQGGQWETMCISENEVKNYTVTEEGRRKVLLLNLSEVVVVGALEGSSLTIHFSSLLDVMQAVCSVYGHSKNKDFLGKKSTSVGKTTVKIVMDENSSQVVPESQVSLGVTEKNTAPPVEMVTPAKMRISESTTFISNSTGRSVLGASSLSAVMPSNNPARGGGKPSLENMAEALDMVLSREGEEQSLGDSFVPDTQPLTEINVPSNWNKLSVSEMIIMPTQKISTLPRPAKNLKLIKTFSLLLLFPYSGLAPQQECPNVAQRLSVSCSGPVSQKQFHTRLTHRLQQVLSEKGQNCAPQEPAAPQRKKSDIRENLKAKSSADQHASTFCTPKEQQPQRNGPTKDMSGLQTSLEENIAPKSLQPGRPQPKQSRSEYYTRDAEAAGSMVNLISSHYRFNTRSTGKGITQDCPQNCLPSLVNWPSLNISWFSATKRDVSGAVIKSHSKTVTNSSRQGEDVFAFNADSQLSIGAKDKSIINTSAISYSDNCDSLVLHSTNKKGQPVAKQKTQNVKKQLFSDTDTDCAMTEVSWLRESSRNAKHKVTVYSRQAPVKPKAATPHALCDSKDIPSTNPKPAKESTKPKKKMPGGTQKVEQPKKRVKPAAVSSRLHAAGRRPKRAVATANKSYKEPNTDSSQSESETPPVPKNCFIGQQGKKKENCFRVSDVKRAKNPPQ